MVKHYTKIPAFREKRDLLALTWSPVVITFAPVP